MKCLALFALLVCSFGCAGSPALVGGGEIRNVTSGSVTQVQAVFQPTERTVSANRILPGRSLKLGFSPREMQADSVELTWVGGDGQPRSASLGVPANAGDFEQQPGWVVYSLLEDGTATVQMVPLTP